MALLDFPNLVLGADSVQDAIFGGFYTTVAYTRIGRINLQPAMAGFMDRADLLLLNHCRMCIFAYPNRQRKPKDYYG